jgi:hypothetical protein
MRKDDDVQGSCKISDLLCIYRSKSATNKTASLEIEVIIWWITRNWGRFLWEGYAFCI